MLSIINFFLIVFAYIIIFCIGLKKDTNELKMDLSEMPDKANEATNGVSEVANEVSEASNEVSEASNEVSEATNEVSATDSEVSSVDREQQEYDEFFRQVRTLYDAVAEVNQDAVKRWEAENGRSFIDEPTPYSWMTGENPREPLGAVDSIEELEAHNVGL